MSIRPIITLPDNKLRLTSTPLAKVDDTARDLLDDMIETMYDAPGIGLAAIQVGVPQRLIVLDLAREGETKQPLFLVNPEIVWSSPSRSVYEEGCLSIPDYYEEVERPAEVRVRFLDRNGAESELKAESLLATAIQHEIDHLNGVLFVDHISKLKRDRVIRKFAKAARRALEEGRPFNPREGERTPRPDRTPPRDLTAS